MDQNSTEIGPKVPRDIVPSLQESASFSGHKKQSKHHAPLQCKAKLLCRKRFESLCTLSSTRLRECATLSPCFPWELDMQELDMSVLQTCAAATMWELATNCKLSINFSQGIYQTRKPPFFLTVQLTEGFGLITHFFSSECCQSFAKRFIHSFRKFYISFTERKLDHKLQI